MKLLVLLFSTLLILSCNKETANVKTYFGGQVINPKDDYVYLYKDDQLLDSSKLNANHKFLISLDSLELGLYIFKHWDELQYIYLEPKDSLLIRINTWDFDESLVFSGRGAERNNFLINLFLENEKENKFFFNFYHLNDSLFELKIDSLLQRKKLFYDQFKEEIPESSPLFEKLAHAAIYYPLYRIKEAYPYRHRKATKTKEYPHTHPIFYKFRKEIDLNDKDLISFYAHRDYVRTYLFHLAYEKQIIDSFKNPMEINFMKVALENIENNQIKNKFLHEGMWMTLLEENSTQEQKDDAQRLFFDHCTDKKSVTDIAQLIKASELSPKGRALPDLVLTGFNNDQSNLKTLIKDKKVVLYTWPVSLNEIENFAKRIAYLERKYPDYSFIGVNTNNPEQKWRHYIKSKKINPLNQYKTSENNPWLDVSFARAILVDKQGIVQNNMTHLSSSQFEDQLKKLN